MAVIDRYRSQDQEATAALYRRVFGDDAAAASRLRWDWQYRANPACGPEGPPIWLAREGPSIIGQYATMPVTLRVLGQEVPASWGMDVMVAPERQRQGLGEQLFGVWDRHVGASLGLGLSVSSYRLFQKLRWPDLGPVPCLVKPLTRRALRQPQWSGWTNKIVSAVTLPVIKVTARPRPLDVEPVRIRRFDAGFTDLWTRIAPAFDLAVRRDASYLQWKYASAPHVRYHLGAVVQEGQPLGYVVYRHSQEPRGRVTLLVDFLADPDDPVVLPALLRWVDREARAADSDKIRTFCLHTGFRRVLKRHGYFQVKSTLQFVAKINAVDVPQGFYRNTERWHVTLGDSDQDR